MSVPMSVIVSPLRMYSGGGGGGGYYGLVGVMRPPCQKTFLCEHDNLKNPERIAFIFYM